MNHALGHYVSKRGLGNLHAYKYSGVDNSLVARHVMQPFWTRAVNYLPLWMAPNLVTLTGFVFIILSYLVTSYYHPAIIGGGPRWVYVLNAVCMFVYQTMDALDGKQARRTASSSPLGELFDHGCDAVTTVLGTITLASTTECDPTLLLVSMVLMMTAFYCAQWEEYFTGTLTLGYIGVTEAQISAIVIYLLTAFFGVPWWNQVLHVGGGWSVRYGSIPMLVSALSMVPTALSNFKEVVAFHMSDKEGSRKLAGVAVAAYKLLPILVLSFGFLAWAAYSPHQIYYSHPQMFLLAYGFLVANLVGRIVLDRVCMVNFQPLQLLILPLVVFLSWLAYVLTTTTATKATSRPPSSSLTVETYFLFCYCVLAVLGYFHFALSVIHDLCETLQINCLTLRKQKS